MKRISSWILWSLLGLIFVPLLLAMLFLFPVEFAVSSWQLMRVSATTEGVVLESEVTKSSGRHSDLLGSRLIYAYEVDGKSYTGKRIEAGWITDHAFQQGGDLFAKENPVGSKLPVYYDPDEPSFSLISWGWPKWSVVFSMVVWGMLTAYWVRQSERRDMRKRVLLAVTKAVTFTGVISVFSLPVTLGLREIKWVAVIYGASAIVVFLYYLIRPLPEPIPDDEKDVAAEA